MQRYSFIFILIFLLVTIIETVAINQKERYNDIEDFFQENDNDRKIGLGEDRKRKIRSAPGDNPNDQGYMDMYISESCRDRRAQAYRMMKFPYVRYDRRRYPSYGLWVRVSRRMLIYVEIKTKQTMIYAPNGVYILPGLMNRFGRVYSIAQLLAYRYATLQSNGVPMTSDFNIAYYAHPIAYFGRDMPGYNPRSGGYSDVIRTNYRSHFQPDCAHEYFEQADDRRPEDNEFDRSLNDKNEYYNAPRYRTRAPLSLRKATNTSTAQPTTTLSSSTATTKQIATTTKRTTNVQALDRLV